MRIGFDAKRAMVNKTGLGNYSRNLINALIKYFPQHNYILYSPKPPSPEFTGVFDEKGNILIKHPHSFIDKLVPSYWRTIQLSKEILKDNIDVYHGLSHELPAGITKTGVPSVVTIHDLIFLRYPQYYPLIDRKIYDRKFRFSCKNASKIVAISEQTKQDLIEFYNIEPEKIYVIYQSCDPGFLVPQPREILSEVRGMYNLPDRFILYVGAISERKNVLTLAEAAIPLLKQGSVGLVLVGDGGAYRAEVIKHLAENNVLDKVRLIKYVEKKHLPALYRLASVFVYPSVFEGFGIPIIEALFSDTPVVTSTGSCFAEAGGPSTIYVNPGDPNALTEAIQQVLENEDLRTKMITDGLAYAQKFTEENFAKKMMKLYQSIK